jgi:tRNA-modifying protein YgfZ
VSDAVRIAERPRAFVRVSGPSAEEYLQRMVSNDVAELAPGDTCDALLLTPKARVIAPVRVVRRMQDDYLLLTEPELGEVVHDHLLRFRFAARAEIALEEHDSFVALGDLSVPEGVLAVPSRDYGVPSLEVVDGARPDGAEPVDAEELERLRIAAGTPAFGREIDERVLPAEAGLVERAVSLTKGCYPGQEPIARLHYRGHANRGLRRLLLEAAEPPAPETEIRLDGKVVGRVTSAVRSNGRVLALGYLRKEVPEDARLDVGGAAATPLH